MKFGNSKVMATIMALAMATTLAGCSKDENNSVLSDSDTEKDLLTSSSSIDLWSAQESIDSSLNSHDTSKPIEKTEPDSSTNSESENPTSDVTSSDDENPSGDNVSSDLTDGGDNANSSANSSSDLTDDKSDSTGETSSQPTGETSKPSDNTTSVPSDSSLADDKDSSANSSTSSGETSSQPSGETSSDGETSQPSDGTSDSVTNEEFKAVFGYDIPEGATNITKDGYDMPNGHVLSPAALAARDEAMRKGEEAIKNGTFSGTAGMTDDDYALLDSIFFG